MAAIDYYSTTGCKVGETDNYDSVTKIHHCLGLAVSPTDRDIERARVAMDKFIKETATAKLAMNKLEKEAVAAQKLADKKAEAAKEATQKAYAMLKATADYYKSKQKK